MIAKWPSDQISYATLDDKVSEYIITDTAKDDDNIIFGILQNKREE